MDRRLRLVAALVVPVAFACSSGGAAAASVRPESEPVTVTAAFDAGAVLGSSTALSVDLRLDPRHLTTAQLTGVRFEYPRSLGIASSGLGLAACRRPASDFAQVLISGPKLGGCPPNAVLGYGIARAIIQLVDGQAIPEYATVTVLTGPFERGRLGLVVFVDGERPFGAKLAFAGDVRGARAPYGGALDVRMPAVPGIAELATISLVQLRIDIGSHAIRYYEHRFGQRIAYRPEGIELPARCPPHGFRFRARLSFADGTHRSATTTAPCPPAVAPPRRSR